MYIHGYISTYIFKAIWYVGHFTTPQTNYAIAGTVIFKLRLMFLKRWAIVRFNFALHLFWSKYMHWILRVLMVEDTYTSCCYIYLLLQTGQFLYAIYHMRNIFAHKLLVIFEVIQPLKSIWYCPFAIQGLYYNAFWPLTQPSNAILIRWRSSLLAIRAFMDTTELSAQWLIYLFNY